MKCIEYYSFTYKILPYEDRGDQQRSAGTCTNRNDLNKLKAAGMSSVVAVISHVCFERTISTVFSLVENDHKL